MAVTSGLPHGLRISNTSGPHSHNSRTTGVLQISDLCDLELKVVYDDQTNPTANPNWLSRRLTWPLTTLTTRTKNFRHPQIYTPLSDINLAYHRTALPFAAMQSGRTRSHCIFASLKVNDRPCKTRMMANMLTTCRIDVYTILRLNDTKSI